MGQFRFAVPLEYENHLRMWESAYICGIEGVPWEGRVTLQDNILTVHRGVDDSGRLYVPFPTSPDGPLMTLATCSLRQTGSQRSVDGGAGPHLLPLELARGECFRLRNQADLWRRAGLQLEATQLQQLQASTETFLQAACLRGDREDVAAQATESIYQLHRAGDMLATAYAEQALAFRKQNERQLGTLIGASVTPEAMEKTVQGGELEKNYRDAFNSIGIPIGLAHMETAAGRIDFTRFDDLFEWAGRYGMRIVAGPLLNFQSKLVPDWLHLYDGDFQKLVESVESYVERAVMRYTGRVHLWHAVAGLNTPGPIDLDEEQIMRLAVVVIHTIRRADPRTPVLISVDRPWGEYLGGERHGISPVHFADALIRSNLGVNGIGLEMRMNYKEGGSLPRSLLDFGQQIDRWANLGLPLLVQMAFPAESGDDPHAIRKSDVIATATGGKTTPQVQDELAIRWINTMLAKGVVHGILWEGWDDRASHYMPHSGLIDAAGKPRPLLDSITRLRRELLT